MSGFITDYLLMFAPLIPGWCVAVILLPRVHGTHTRKLNLPVLYSCSHLIGIIFFSIFIQFSLMMNFNVFNQNLLLGMLILLGCSLIYLLVMSRPLTARLGAIVACHMVFVLVLTFLWGNQPIFGWDALKFWMPAAVDLIEVSSQQDSGWENAKAFQHRHMATVPAIYAWSAWLFERFSQHLMTFNIGFHFAFFLAIFAAYHWRAVTGKRSFSILGATALLTLPLMENHVLISGYAEIWLACYLAAAATAGVMYLERSTTGNLLLFVGLTSSIAFLKNIGFIFALSLGISMCLIKLKAQQAERNINFTRSAKARNLGYTSTFILFTALCITVFNSQGVEYDLAGRVLKLQLNNPLEVLAFQANALIFNASYSLLVFLFVISLCLWARQRKECKPINPQDLLFFTTISLYLTYSLGQIFTDYIYFYSSPNNDTSGSRLFLPIAALAMMCAPRLASITGNKKP